MKAIKYFPLVMLGLWSRLTAQVWGGLMWMTSQGNTERVTKGKNTLVWAVIGLVIIFASYAILSTVFDALRGTAG